MLNLVRLAAAGSETGLGLSIEPELELVQAFVLCFPWLVVLPPRSYLPVLQMSVAVAAASDIVDVAP